MIPIPAVLPVLMGVSVYCCGLLAGRLMLDLRLFLLQLLLVIAVLVVRWLQ